jgi:ABC-type nitrate/sulfonate/bicarbonate transport system ATPase subunit
MTPRPGRIDAVLDIPLSWDRRFGDVRSDPEFVTLRHEVWERLHRVPSAAAPERALEGASVG